MYGLFGIFFSDPPNMAIKKFDLTLQWALQVVICIAIDSDKYIIFFFLFFLITKYIYYLSNLFQKKTTTTTTSTWKVMY
jgi:hypothetical protein